MKIEVITKAAQAQAGADAVGFRMLVPITKVDKDARTIEGVATGEWKDHHGEIVDYAAAKSAFEAWPGNIREMHQPIAAGRAVGITFDDAAKSITVKSYISTGAESTWQKCLDGTLRCYSIGGDGVRKLEKRDGDHVSPVVYLSKMGELSVVDEGALPGSEFAIVKMVDGQPQIVTPADAAEPPVEKAAPVGLMLTGAGFRDLLTAVSKSRKMTLAEDGALTLAEPTTVTKIADGDRVKVAKYIETYDLLNAMNAIAYLQDLVSSEYYDVVYPSDNDAEMADKKSQLDVLRAAVRLVLAFIVSEFEQQFAALDAESAMTPVAMFKAAFEGADVQKAVTEWPASFSALDSTGRVVFIGKAGARHSKSDVDMIQKMHDTALSLGAACASVEKALDLEAVRAFLVEKAADTDETVKAGIAEIVKMLASAPAAAEPIEKGAPTGLTTDQVQKMITTALTDATTKIATLESTVAAQTTTIEKQAAEFETFKAQPAPGGPATRAVAPGSVAVEKSIGNVTPDNVPDPTSLVGTLTEMAKDAPDSVRKWAAEQVIKIQHTGAGIVAIGRQ